MINLTHNGNRITFKGNSISSKPANFQPTQINYGYLYNWWITREKEEGVSIVPENMQLEGWRLYDKGDMQYIFELIDPDPLISDYYMYANEGAEKIKDTSEDYWVSGSEGTNELNFFLRGNGRRNNNGDFLDLEEYAFVWSGWLGRSNGLQYQYYIETYNGDIDFWETSSSTSRKHGYGLRCVRNATIEEQSLPDGLLSDIYYFGNDGKVYRTTKIGNYIWTADNLAETRWNNSDWIKGFDGGTYTPISNQDWSELDEEAALCAYNDNENLV